MPDDTTAALQALLKQVETLTTRMDGLHEFNGKVLDEKKDMQRQLEQQAASDKKWADMGYERAPDGHYYPEPVVNKVWSDHPPGRSTPHSQMPIVRTCFWKIS